MATFTVPEHLLQLIEARAKARGIGIDAQVAELLEKALADDPREAELLAEIRREREEMAKAGVFLTDEAILEAKDWGRK